MLETSATADDPRARIAELERVLAEESGQYERLLDVATRQGRLMTGNDPDAVAQSAAEMAAGLEAADAVRRERERLAEELMSSRGGGGQRLSVWLARQPESVRARLGASVQRVREAGARLMRANEKNRRLASFCLDLVEEEANVLKRSLLQDPAGCYDRGARPTHDGGGRVVRKQA